MAEAAQRIERFHAEGMQQPYKIETAPGVECERVVRPIGRVGLYVPAGSAPLPSTVLMLGIPARLAGCPAVVLGSPPRQAARQRVGEGKRVSVRVEHGGRRNV